MSDVFTKSKRSEVMSHIRSRDTGPERTVRSMLHRMGYRFRLHRKDLPGKPDIVLPRYRAVVLVHGCFWHRHPGCRFAYVPKSRKAFWQEKFADNVRRDRSVRKQLATLGWRVEVVWECELRCPAKVAARLDGFLRAAKVAPREATSGRRAHQTWR